MRIYLHGHSVWWTPLHRALSDKAVQFVIRELLPVLAVCCSLCLFSLGRLCWPQGGLSLRLHCTDIPISLRNMFPPTEFIVTSISGVPCALPPTGTKAFFAYSVGLNRSSLFHWPVCLHEEAFRLFRHRPWHFLLFSQFSYNVLCFSCFPYCIYGVNTWALLH
ncbi:hypothetical protein DM02DRAFT_354795 [Periconia macrospinosa]|uniref:Uncharacterized protein n=1 Tax=Periconia macrospinosa TaxID=97972 RepID=A0A2V1E9G1_9PLEO|nr:hypothetical protein DM02DRAFT_354795 [Periconia macrospinosa]